MQAELGNKEAVDQADDAAHQNDSQQHHGNGNFGQGVKHFVGPVGRLKQCGRDGGGQADDAAGRKVGAGQDDTAGDAQRSRQRGSRQADDVDQRAGHQKVGILYGSKDDKDDQQNVDGVVQQGINDLAALVPGVHRFEFCHALFQIGDCLHGWFLPVIRILQPVS